MNDEIIACICEGSAEQAILEILLEDNKLEFCKEQLLERKILRCRSAKSFENQYLSKGFSKKVKIYRILDSRKEKFKLSTLYAKKVEVINVVTAPEIEMLVICKEGKFDDYKKGNIKKPSEYCKVKLGLGKVKNYQFVKNYFSNSDELCGAIKDYKQKSNIPKGEITLFDLLR